MLNWLRFKIQNFLGVTDLYKKYKSLEDRFNRLEIKFNNIQTTLNNAVSTNKDVLNKNEYIMSYFNLSADIYPSQRGESWAVISIQGKPEYVKFVNLSNSDMREINAFLRRFERTNRTIDTPMGIEFLRF